MVKNGQKMFKNVQKMVKKSEYLLIRIFWTGRDSPPLWPKVKEQFLCLSLGLETEYSSQKRPKSIIFKKKCSLCLLSLTICKGWLEALERKSHLENVLFQQNTVNQRRLRFVKIQSQIVLNLLPPNLPEAPKGQIRIVCIVNFSLVLLAFWSIFFIALNSKVSLSRSCF